MQNEMQSLEIKIAKKIKEDPEDFHRYPKDKLKCKDVMRSMN